jgi:CRISPR-associated protein Csm5
MEQYCHLKTYEIILTTKSPLFIGSGKEYSKKEYYYYEKNKIVHIINNHTMFSMLISYNLVDEYERYMINRPDEYLHEFLKDCRFTKAHINAMTDYQINIGNAIFEDKSLSSIMQFIRNTKMQPYVPGSSLKGCLRTAILWQLISENNSIDKNQSAKDIEAYYLNTLKYNIKKQKDAVNSVMRGISISDSMPIDNKNMVLAKKDDVSKSGNINTINTIRESVAPETKIRFILTIDESFCTYINADFIRKAVSNYWKYYKNTFISLFHLPNSAVSANFPNCIVLGGGSGYFGKNIMYPLYGKKLAVEKVSEIMQHKFKNHKHEIDIQYGISPRKLKYTKFNSKFYHYGVCNFEIR